MVLYGLCNELDGSEVWAPHARERACTLTRIVDIQNQKFWSGVRPQLPRWHGLRHGIRLGASGRVVTGFDMARLLSLGADRCNAGRGFMFALGCVQAQSCHTDRCPTGVATQNTWRQRAIVVDDKAVRVRQFHDNTGLSSPNDLRPMHILRRTSPSEVKSFAEIYSFLEPGELLAGHAPRAICAAMGEGGCPALCAAAADPFGRVIEPAVGNPARQQSRTDLQPAAIKI